MCNKLLIANFLCVHRISIANDILLEWSKILKKFNLFPNHIRLFTDKKKKSY
jgi:hypothetical protein